MNREPQPFSGTVAQGIRIVPVGAVDHPLLEWLSAELAPRFDAPVTIADPIPLRREWRDEARRQVQADPILDALVARAVGPDWSLGVADVDLFAPGLSFIFGQATVGGCCALIGLARLRPEFHGEPPRPDLFMRRVLTEAVHELGHVAGIGHCADPGCVMHFSTTLEDTDRKGPDFCDACRA